MDEYEAMSGLWDKQKGPLQPGIEIHYYYLGQYYEGIGKQDSALWYYQNVVDMSDGCLEIPQFGTKHSLNVSVTAGIVVWEFAKLLKL